MRLLVDTNILVDYLGKRDPFFEPARKLAFLAYLGEFELYISSSQFTDVFYMLTEGGKRSFAQRVRQRLKAVRSFVGVVSLGADEIDAALDSNWDDFEDACVYQAALKIKADALITRNQRDFEKSSLKVMDCNELFRYLEDEKGLTYEFVPF